MLCAWTVALLLFASSDGKRIGPKHLASQGKVWPKAWKENKTADAYIVDPINLKFTITGKSCSKVQLAIERCRDYVRVLEKITKHPTGHKENLLQNSTKFFEELKIYLSEKCEYFPHMNMNENYTLQVASIAMLNSSSVWGIIRGMETFSQLFYVSSDYKNIIINGTKIIDKPNYPHRGLMLDTGRHYISVGNILKTLDAMAINKMNVFHWHIVDDESFPYQSLKLPELSKAAFHPTLIYKRKDMELIRDYAKDLGIRILMEFDMPGHSYYMALVYPEIMTKCFDDGKYTPPLNPVKEKTFEILKELIHEVQELFPDSYFHFGGDKVRIDYYIQDQDIQTYIQRNAISKKIGIYKLFFKKAFSLLKNGTLPVVWEDVFNSKVPLPKKSAVQVRQKGNGISPMVNVLKAGYYGIQSAPYSLDVLSHGIERFYQKEPRLAVKKQLKNNKLLKNLIGATACMWGEKVNDNNLMSTVWPRASAIAEVLWSETHGKAPDEATLKRIEEHTCRMNRRGIPAAPPGASFCIV